MSRTELKTLKIEKSKPMLNRPWFITLLLSSLIAYISQIAGDANPALSVSPQAIPATIAQQSSAPAKTTTVQVGDTPQTIPLDVVQTRNFSTYFPTDRFTLERSNNPSAQHEDVKFYWKNPDGTLDRETFIAFVFYNKNAKFREVRKIADVNARILEGYGARRIERSSGISYAKKTYSAWLRDLIRLESKNSQNTANSRNGAATTYLGEVEGQIFVVFSSYRLQYGDEFTSREDVILKNLKVRKRN